jgi:hypothetical protein
MIKSISILIGVILLGLLILGLSAHRQRDKHCLTTQLSSRLFDLNDIKIKVSDSLNVMDFKIKNLNSGKLVFENGKFRKGIKNEYGFCLFNVYYKDSLLYEIGHFKFNNWHTNDYTFVFESTVNYINPTLIISGPDKDKGELFYKRFERNELGVINKISYLDRDKKIYNEEIIKK